MVYVGIMTKKQKNKQKNDLPKPAAQAPPRSTPHHHRNNISILSTKINHQ